MINLQAYNQVKLHVHLILMVSDVVFLVEILQQDLVILHIQNYLIELKLICKTLVLAVPCLLMLLFLLEHLNKHHIVIWYNNGGILVKVSIFRIDGKIGMFMSSHN